MLRVNLKCTVTATISFFSFPQLLLSSLLVSIYYSLVIYHTARGCSIGVIEEFEKGPHSSLREMLWCAVRPCVGSTTLTMASRWLLRSPWGEGWHRQSGRGSTGHPQGCWGSKSTQWRQQQLSREALDPLLYWLVAIVLRVCHELSEILNHAQSHCQVLQAARVCNRPRLSPQSDGPPRWCWGSAGGLTPALPVLLGPRARAAGAAQTLRPQCPEGAEPRSWGAETLS